MTLIPHIFDDHDDRAIDERTVNWFRRVCESADCIAGVRHHVPVRLIATDKIFLDGYECEAIFLRDKQSCEIWLTFLGRTKPAIVRALSHELVHYEQWRDGKECDEVEAEQLENRIANYIARVA